MKKHLRIFLYYYRMNFASSLEYRASFISQALGMALSNGTFLFFWWIAFSQIGGRIAGYSFQDVQFIWSVTSSGFGLAMILFGNATKLTQLIITGELDAFLLQPCCILLNFLCARTSLSAYGDFIYGLVLMAIFYGSHGAAWLWFSVGTLLCCLLLIATLLLAHTLSFYWGDASIVGTLATEFVINFGIYPESIYSPVMRAIMYSVIPVGIAVHLPLRMLGAFSPWTMLMALGGATLYCTLACCFFYRGLRHYASGNVIVIRQ